MSESILHVSETAGRKLAELKDSGKFEGSALRVQADEVGASFHYQLQVVKQDEREDGDTVVESESVSFYIDAVSAGRLAGATLDYQDDINATGFRFENPNKPALLENPIAGKVQQLLDDEVNPGLANHGGSVTLVDVQGGRVFLQFSGGCQGCGMVDTTVRDGIEGILKRAVPEVTEVLDSTDHAAGENPYYSA